MMTTILIVAAVLAAVFFVEIVAAAKAPVGYEDETGFHFAPESRHPLIEEEAALPHGVGCLNPS